MSNAVDMKEKDAELDRLFVALHKKNDALMRRYQSNELELKKVKDAELDRLFVALRKKNDALMRRYQSNELELKKVKDAELDRLFVALRKKNDALMRRYQSNAVDMKKEEKCAELDRRIEALRKKNEGLMRRYQEIEQDKKKAEQEGIAVTTPRKPRSHEPDSVDLSKLSGEKRLVNDRKVPPHRSDQDVEESELLHGESPPRKSGTVRLNRVAQRGGAARGSPPLIIAVWGVLLSVFKYLKCILSVLL
ncbi:uncharacterized protein LOC143478247 [Brachyhypopomus gauderio]|uniref:uncharacterized protein LOC143478247 n=1 Tax=Brachyhypopomus gauderio TaxID=698409 RepID=UPI004042920C